MTENKHKFFNIILILLPFIDVITSYMVRNNTSSITLGMLVKAFMLLYFVFYIFFITGSKYKKVSIKYMVLLFIFVILYFAFKPELISGMYLFNELKFLFKIVFFPIMFFGMLCLYSDSGFKEDTMKKIMFISLISYSILLFFPYISGQSYGTYTNGKNGFIGWYYAGNEVSTVITLLFPFLYYLIDKGIKGSVIISLPIIIMISRIGTKVSFFGLVLVGLIMLIIEVLKQKKIFCKQVIKCLIMFICIVFFMYNGYTLNNMKKNVQREIKETKTVRVVKKTAPKPSKTEIILKAFLSNRDKFLYNTHVIYEENNTIYVTLFGLGFSNTSKIDDRHIEKLVEMDAFDLFYHTGTVGLLLIIYPFLYAFYSVIKYIRRNKFNIDIVQYTIFILLVLAISFICGHVLLDPPVSIYVALYLMLLLNEAGTFKKKNLISNKVSMYALHLGFGGTEKSTVDVANMLSKKYDVNIISLYQTEKDIPYTLNENITVTYLSNSKPRKDELIKNLKHFKLIKALKISEESIRLLYKKYILMRNLISYDNSKYIISTRDSFTKILSKYGRKNVNKLAVEHNYDISEKHINYINKNFKNIDKFVVVSRDAAKIYKKYITNVEIVNIPNSVDNEYKVLSKLDNRLISVGRLEKEKGYLDLIEVFNLVHQKDNTIKLDIFGDGREKSAIKRKLAKYDLEKHVILHGFQDGKEISKYYKNAGLFVMCSLKESFGIVLIESMKCGVPAIAFKNITGASEIIRNGKNGFLIPNRDKEEMAKQIIKYMKLKNKKKYQEKALKTAEKYSFEEIQKRWLSLLMEL